MIKIGIVGFGYWGPNLVRNFSMQNDCIVKAIADKRLERLNIVKKSYPDVKTVQDVGEIINDPEIDAVVIATPVSSHYTLAKMALLKGKHVLVEKPFTSSVDEAKELIDIAFNLGKVIMVDHTFLYTGAVNKMRSLIVNGEIGELKYFDSTRVNLGLFQSDINVLWDLAPHDLSILNYLVEERPISVNATGISHVPSNLENIAYLTLNYASGFIAHISCSWVSPVKVRMILLGGNKKMILYNDNDPTEKIKVYDSGYSLRSESERGIMLMDYRIGDIYTPKIPQTEALFLVASDFLGAIMKGNIPISNSKLGLEVVSVLEASEKSLKENGSEIRIKY